MCEPMMNRMHNWMSEYSTPMNLMVHDAKVGYVTKVYLITVTVYVLFATITQFTYMGFETPLSVRNVYYDSTDFKAAYDARKNTTDAPAYCATADTDYIYSASWKYVNNKCRNTAGALPEIWKKSAESFSLVSYYTESVLMPSGEYAPEPSQNNFFPHVEDVVVEFTHAFSTGNTKNQHDNVKTTLKGRAVKDKDGKHTENKIEFKDGETFRVKMGTLLDMAGISLDAPNADSGGNPPPVGGKNWPSYRLTGVGLVIKAGYYNVNPSRPFDRSTFGEYVVQTTTEGGWMSKGPRVMTIPQGDGGFKLVERYEYAVKVEFKNDGRIGHFNFFALLYTLTVVVTFAFVTANLTQALSHALVARFNDMSVYTKTHWLSLEAMVLRAREDGEMQDAAIALGVEMEAPSLLTQRLARHHEGKIHSSMPPRLGMGAGAEMWDANGNRIKDGDPDPDKVLRIMEADDVVPFKGGANNNHQGGGGGGKSVLFYSDL